MKRLPLILALIIAGAWVFTACSSDDNESIAEIYADWNAKNEAWLKEVQTRTNPDGSPYYTTLVPNWNSSAFVLIHYFNDRSLTEGNLSPLYTSTVDTRYHLSYYNDEAIDSSTLVTKYGPGIFRTQLSSVIEGWSIALLDMRCGDTAEVIVPYAQAYGVSASTSILPYSNLKFNIRLVDIPYYEVKP